MIEVILETRDDGHPTINWIYNKNGECAGSCYNLEDVSIILINLSYFQKPCHLNRTILHELCHWGNNDKGRNSLIDNNPKEVNKLLRELSECP